jgi:hypothetical protein
VIARFQGVLSMPNIVQRFSVGGAAHRPLHWAP